MLLFTVKVSRREGVIGLGTVITPLLISPFANAPNGDCGRNVQGSDGRRVEGLDGER